jgi:hypothetical protein
LLLTTLVSAVTIHQVLYDPSSESGEAVQLYNPENKTINLTGWVLATDSSEKDVTIQGHIQAFSFFIIADMDWEKHKEISWSKANYHENMNLKNKNSFVQLKNDKLIDEANWTTGKNIIKINNTFVENTPSFVNANLAHATNIHITINETQTITQKTFVLTPIPDKNATINITGNATPPKGIHLIDGKLHFPYFLPSNNYTITTDKENITIEFLSLAHITLDTQQLRLTTTPGKNTTLTGDNSFSTLAPTLKNTGNTPVDIGISWNANTPLFITANNITLQAHYALQKIPVNLAPQQTLPLHFTTTGTQKGTYESDVTIVAIKT